MNNFPFQHEGQTLWYSRSLACNLVIITTDREGKNPKVLACKRGQGCEFNKGLWNVPGGFIDFNENAINCTLRETFEETGVKIDPKTHLIKFLYLDTEPRSHRQTMIASHYVHYYDDEVKDWVFSDEWSEPGEVEEIKWIPIKEIKDYNWTNNQFSNIVCAWDAIKNDCSF